MAVLNKHKSGIPPGAVYIGRGSRWGNRFTHLPGVSGTTHVASRDEACERHEAYLAAQVRSGEVSLEELASLHEKDLVCFCAPERCHGHTLQKAALWAFQQLQEKK